MTASSFSEGGKGGDNQGNQNKKTYIFDIIASKVFYSTEQVSPFNLDQSLKDVEILIPLENQKVSIKQAIIEEIIIPPPVIKGIEIAQKLKDPETFAIKDISKKIMDRVRESLIPQVLQLIVQFGIGKAQEALGKKMDELNTTCPANLDDLNKIIKIKNDLTRILQNIFNTLETIKIGVDFADKAITIADVALGVLKSLVSSFPIAGLGAPDPSKKLLEPDGVLDKISKFLKKAKVVTSGLLLVLSLLTTTIARLLQFLSLLDALIQKCHIEGALPNEEIPTILFNPAVHSRSFEPNNHFKPKLGNTVHYVVLGGKDDLIPADKTVKCLDSYGVTYNKSEIPTMAHQIPLDIFINEVNNRVKELDMLTRITEKF